MAENFQVDLAGMVDLLSRHLYSSPRVYLRELLQNAVDAITARAALEPACTRRIDVVPADVSPDGRLHVRDTGIGLDASGMADVLATIGRSSKRLPDGAARGDFIGQFGIGLLSCFMVTDRIELLTRVAGAPAPLRWVGSSDGTYDVHPAADGDLPATGSAVSLAPLPGREDLLSAHSVRLLLRTFATYLPCDVVLHTVDGEEHVGAHPFPWDDPTLTGVSRRAAAVDLCRDLLGFDPLDVITLTDPETGLHGLAFVTPEAVDRSAHRVYLRRMLVTESSPGLLPEWAFFVRAVVDVEGLRPTASREALFEDDGLDAARGRLGEQLRGWLDRTLTTESPLLHEFLRVHHLAVKAMATHDDEMLEAVGRWLPFETTLGDLTLRDFVAAEGVLRHTTTTTDFRQVSAMATAQGLGVVNAGYAYDGAIVDRWVRAHPEVPSQRMSPTSVLAHVESPAPAQAAAFAGLLEVARETLLRAGCDPVVRSFEPPHLHALLLADRDARMEQERAVVEAASDEIWGALLASVARPSRRPQLVLNARSALVARLAASSDASLQSGVLEALYAHAVISGHHRLRPYDSALIARALPALIDRLLDR